MRCEKLNAEREYFQWLSFSSVLILYVGFFFCDSRMGVMTMLVLVVVREIVWWPWYDGFTKGHIYLKEFSHCFGSNLLVPILRRLPIPRQHQKLLLLLQLITIIIKRLLLLYYCSYYSSYYSYYYCRYYFNNYYCYNDYFNNQHDSNIHAAGESWLVNVAFC